MPVLKVTCLLGGKLRAVVLFRKKLDEELEVIWKVCKDKEQVQSDTKELREHEEGQRDKLMMQQPVKQQKLQPQQRQQRRH